MKNDVSKTSVVKVGTNRKERKEGFEAEKATSYLATYPTLLAVHSLLFLSTYPSFFFSLPLPLPSSS